MKQTCKNGNWNSYSSFASINSISPQLYAQYQCSCPKTSHARTNGQLRQNICLQIKYLLSFPAFKKRAVYGCWCGSSPRCKISNFKVLKIISHHQNETFSRPHYYFLWGEDRSLLAILRRLDHHLQCCYYSDQNLKCPINFEKIILTCLFQG